MEDKDINLVEGTPDEVLAERLVNLYEDIDEQNEDIKEIKSDQKDMIDLFCEQNEEFTKKQVKAGFKYFIKVLKDRSEVTVDELEREKIIELIESKL